MAMAALSTALVACGSGGDAVTPGGGGGGASIPLTVVVEDAPIVGVIVQDRDGGAGAQTAQPVLSAGVPTGRYTFSVTPTLPIRVTSQNLQSPDSQFKVVFVEGAWWSYLDANRNNAFDTGEQRAPLSFQDLDGNGLYTQSTDVLYNGKLKLNYVPGSAQEVRVNIVASLIPQGWNGTTAVAGLPPSVLNEAVTNGPTASSNTLLKQTTAVLTAISEALVAPGAATRDQLTTVVAAVAASTAVNLASTGTAAAAALAQVVAAAVPTAQSQAAQNITANVQSVVNTAVATSGESGGSALTANFEAIVKVAQANSTTLAQAPLAASSGTVNVQTLVTQTVSTSQQIAVDQQSAQPGVDPEAALVATLRLFPWLDVALIEQGQSPTGPFQATGRTTSFSLERLSGGAIRLRAAGEPFASALGASLVNGSADIPFSAAAGQWRLLQGSGAQQQGVLIDLRSGFEDPVSKNYIPGAMVRVCVPAEGGCWPYMLATEAQICQVLNGGVFATNPARRSTALDAVRAINAAGLNCP